MANLTPVYVRAANPVWIFRDLTGNPLDDQYYAHFLTNELPYVPQPPFDGPFNSASPWTGGIVQFAANGALPNNLYFDDDLTYRIEIRKGNSQSDQLLYAINNFVPAGDGGGTDDVNLVGDNLITNPQFVVTSFNSSYSETGSDFTIDVAPGWQIITTGGSGTITVSLQTATADQNIPGQAPFFLRVNSSGNFTSVRLKQRFNNNGGLFFSMPEEQRAASTYVAAKTTTGTPDISANLRSSDGNADVLLFSVSLNTSWNAFTGNSGFLPESSNSDSNDDAYVDYDLDLPVSGVVDVTSLQVISQTNLQEPTFEQESTERQLDHTWHYYREEVIEKPKDTILTAWNFPLNPFQFRSRTVAATGSKAQYIADQTIIWQEGGSARIKAGSASNANRRALQLKANTASSSNNKFSLIQYIDPQTIRPYWSYFVSSLVRARLSTTHGTEVRFKMRLIYRNGLPPKIGSSEPISDMSSEDPVFSAGWTALEPKNDPIYTLPNSNSPETEGGRAWPAFSFDEFALPDSAGADMTLGIVLYTLDNLDNSSPEDSILIDKISLVPNRFAVDSNPQTFDQVLRASEFYYEKSYNTSVLPGTVTSTGERFQQLPMTHAGSTFSGDILRRHAFSLDFRTYKRANPTKMTFYAPTLSTAGKLLLQINRGASQPTAITGSNPAIVDISSYTQHQLSPKGVIYYSKNTAHVIEVGFNEADEGLMLFHYVADSRLGV